MCRVRVYFPDEERDRIVIIYSELQTNSGSTITNAAEIIAAGVIQAHKLESTLDTFPVFIEHYPPETTDGRTESFELVLFDSYEVRKRRASYAGDDPLTIGEPTWKEIDRSVVETLVGQDV